MDAQVLVEWSGQHYAHAIDLAEARMQHDPSSRIAVELLQQTRPGLPTDQAKRLLTLVVRCPSVSRLDLSNLGLVDLGFLHGLPLRHLILSGNKITDLRPLSGMPLEVLILTDNQVSDLTPLWGMPLTRLDLTNNRVADLSGIQVLTSLQSLTRACTWRTSPAATPRSRTCRRWQACP